MGLLGGILGGVGSAVAGIVGGNATRKAARRNEKLLNEAEERNKAWYEKNFHSSFLDRSEARSTINKARELLSERYRAAEGAAAVGGATAESVAQQKAAANETLANVAGNIAERADAYKDQVRESYEAKQDAITQQRMGINNQRAQATAQAAQGVAAAANSLGNIIPI